MGTTLETSTDLKESIRKLLSDIQRDSWFGKNREVFEHANRLEKLIETKLFPLLLQSSDSDE